MDKVYVAVFHGKAYSHNGCCESDIKTFKEMRFALSYVNRELARQSSIEKPEGLIMDADSTYVRAEKTYIAHCTTSGHWRPGGIILKVLGDVKEGRWEKVEIFPSEVE